MLGFSEEQRAFQATAREFAQGEMAPHASTWDAKSIFPRETLQAAADLGFGALYVRDDIGGSGLLRLDGAIIFEELSRACPSTAAYISIHNMVAWMIDAFGHDDQRQRFLPKLVSMQHFASYCLTEPGAGSDAASLKTKAEKDGDSYVLNGAKAFISGAGATDIYLVMARTGGEGASGVSAFIVEAGTPGLSFGAEERKLGWKSQPTAAVSFDDCRIPSSNRLGDEGQGFKIAMAGLDGGRINIAACSLGGAAECLDRAAAYSKDRTQFGKAISDFQVTQFKLADMSIKLEAARLMVHEGARSLDAGDPARTVAAAKAKRFATETCYSIVDEALQIHGGYGYLMDYEIERFKRDLRVHRILEGTNEIMSVIIARALLKDA